MMRPSPTMSVTVPRVDDDACPTDLVRYALSRKGDAVKVATASARPCMVCKYASPMWSFSMGAVTVVKMHSSGLRTKCVLAICDEDTVRMVPIVGYSARSPPPVRRQAAR